MPDPVTANDFLTNLNCFSVPRAQQLKSDEPVILKFGDLDLQQLATGVMYAAAIPVCGRRAVRLVKTETSVVRNGRAAERDCCPIDL